MTTYLEGGWYAPDSSGLRPEVIDGAMDIAGVLLRAGVTATTLQEVALKIRSHWALLDPAMEGEVTWGSQERERLLDRLQEFTDETPELGAFVLDCLDRVAGRRDLTAFYLHVVHVAKMVHLLSAAMSGEIAPPTTEPLPEDDPTPPTSPDSAQSIEHR